jgi:hypothetical protein
LPSFQRKLESRFFRPKLDPSLSAVNNSQAVDFRV